MEQHTQQSTDQMQGGGSGSDSCNQPQAIDAPSAKLSQRQALPQQFMSNVASSMNVPFPMQQQYQMQQQVQQDPQLLLQQAQQAMQVLAAQQQQFPGAFPAAQTQSPAAYMAPPVGTAMPPFTAPTPFVPPAASVAAPNTATMPVQHRSNDIYDVGEPPKEKPQEELDAMPANERRRYERNLREQHRSYRISQQIKRLQLVLAESNVPFKPNKFSILANVVDYIKRLQSRAIMLDNEHQRLQETIQQTNEMVASGNIPSNYTSDELSDTVDGENSFIQDVNFRRIFTRCPFALGVSALDGRVLACNQAFENLLGAEEMESQSLFLFIQNHQVVFQAMADLLKRFSESVDGGVEPSQELLFWTGSIVTQTNRQLSFSISLTNTISGNPKYFSFSAFELSS